MLPEQLLHVGVSPIWSETGGSSEGNLRAALGRPFWPAATRCFVSATHLLSWQKKKPFKSMGRRCVGTFAPPEALSESEATASRCPDAVSESGETEMARRGEFSKMGALATR